MKRQIWIPLVMLLLSTVLSILVVLVLLRKEQKKIAVVDAIQLFNSFKMKIEMEEQAAVQFRALTSQADSLKNELTLRSKAGVKSDAIEALYKQYVQASRQLEAAYEASNRDINEQVWKRLNPLIDEYGKQAGLRLIIGANGMGTVLYNDEYFDHTKSITTFVNKRYEKGN
jgi:outer membrane protein